MGQPKSGSSTTSPSPSGVAALNQVLPQVQQYLSPTTNPYVPVTQQIAQQNPEQLAAAQQYSNAFGAANTGLGTYGQASDLVQGAAQPLTQAEINQYFNPYVNQVVGATEAQFANMNAQQQNQVVGNETAQGALGGNRTAVAGALTAAQQAAQEDPIIAGMLQAGYTQQEAMAAQQYQQAPLAAASALQQIGSGQEAAANNLGNLALGQYGLGTQQQSYNTPGAPTTATLNALYAEQLARYGYPIQLTNMAAGDISGLSSAYGSNTTTTPPPPSLVSGIAGAGLGLAALGQAGAFAPLAAMISTGGRVNGFRRGGVVTAPESHRTLHAQQRQLLEGHRRVQMFPHGSKELSLPSGMRRVEAHSGVFHYNPDKISEAEIHKHAASGNEHHLLDLGPYSKQDIMHRVRGGEVPVGVVERHPDGTEVRAAVGTHATAAEQAAHMERTKSPGHHIHVEDVRHTLARRAAGGRIQGLQTGGVPAMPYGASPMSGLGPIPYAGGGSYIPQVGAPNIARLAAAPPMAQPQDDSSNMFMNALKLSNLGSKSSSDSLANYSPAEVDYAAALPGATGGRVPRAYGGLALPSSNRINVSTRGGLGMPSSMVMRRDAGGSADMSDTSTSAGADVPPLNPMLANITYGLYGEAAPYGAQGMAEGGTPKDDIAPDDTVLVPDETPPPEAPVQVAQGPSPAGVATDAPEIISTGVSRRAPEDPRGMVPYIRETAKKYGIDPNVAVNVARSEGLGTFTSGIPGEKSFGAFQLNTQGGMGNEFYRDTGLDPSDPRNERATIDYALSKASTGGWGPFHGAKNRYGYSNFAGINGNDGTQALALTEDTSGRGLATASPDTGGIPGVTPIKAQDISGKTKPNKDDIWMSLLAAGLGMMGSRSPYAGVGIGQGGLQGVQTYEALHKQRVGEAEHQATLDLNAQIHGEAQRHNLQGEQHQREMLGKPIKITNSWGEEYLVHPDTGVIVGPPPIHGTGGGNRVAPDQPSNPGQAGQSKPNVQVASADESIGLPEETGEFKEDKPNHAVHPEVLAGLDKEEAGLVKAIAEGRKKFLPTTGRNGQRNSQLNKLVFQYDEQADETKFGTRQQTANFFAVGKGGQGGLNIAASNTWAQHMNDYLHLSQEMGLGRYTTVNNWYNWATEHGYTTKQAQETLSQFRLARDAVAAEGAKIFSGSQNALADREEWKKRFADETPANVAVANAKEAANLVNARLNSLKDQYNKGMSTKHETGEFLAPRTRAIMDNIQNTKDRYTVLDSEGKPVAGATPIEGKGPVKVQTKAEANKLPSGTHYVTPDGQEFTR